MIEYFQQFSLEEVHQFEKFILSPYFNTNRKNIKIFEYLRSRYPDILAQDIKKEVLFKAVYGKAEYNDTNARRLISDFTEVMENFVLQVERQESKPLNYLNLLTALNKRGIKKRYETNLKKANKYFEAQFLKDDDYYFAKLNINFEDYLFRLAKIRFEYPEQLNERSDNLDYFFIFSKLHTFRDMHTHNYNSGKNFNFNKKFYEEIISFIKINEKDIKENHPNIYFVYLSLMMEADPYNNFYVKSYTDYLEFHAGKIPVSRLKYFYNYLISNYTAKINGGQISLRNNLLELYKVMDANNMFLGTNHIKDLEFNTIVATALTTGNFEWAEYFINKYKKYLEIDSAESILNMAFAKLLFYKKNYNEALKHLHGINESIPTYFIGSRILIVKIFYETNQFDQIYYVIDNLLHYARRGKNIGGQGIQNIKKFSYYMKNLVKLNMHKEDAYVILKELENDTAFIPDKNWLSEKIAEIKKGRAAG